MNGLKSPFKFVQVMEALKSRVEPGSNFTIKSPINETDCNAETYGSPMVTLLYSGDEDYTIDYSGGGHVLGAWAKRLSKARVIFKKDGTASLEVRD